MFPSTQLVDRYSGKENAYSLFATDYTENSLLADFKPPSLRRILEDKPDLPLIQITAWDGQEFVRQLKLGSIYIFQDVRIKTDQSGGFKGHLKLAEHRITKVNTKENVDPRLIQLLKEVSMSC